MCAQRSWTGPRYAHSRASAARRPAGAARGALLVLAVATLATACGPDPGTDAAAGTDAGGAVCGNGITEAAEECDDANLADGDGCSAACADETPPTTCGNGVVEPGETCDDLNAVAGDGCDAACQREPYVCAVAAAVACGDTVSADTTGAASGRDDHCAFATLSWTGPELVYRFVAAATETVAFVLVPGAGAAGALADLDAAVVTGSCEALACVAGPSRPPVPSGGAAPSLEVARALVTAGASYWVYVDGVARAAGPFELRVGCAADAVCGDGDLQGDEACDDANAAPGDGCTATCAAEADADACPSPTARPLVAGADPLLVMVDTLPAPDTLSTTCTAAIPACAGGGDVVLPVIVPRGSTGFEVEWEQGGDHLFAVAVADPTCVERACVDPYPASAAVTPFAALTDGSDDVLVGLVVSACGRTGAGRVALSLRAL